jgi:pyruvate-formate lyase
MIHSTVEYWRHLQALPAGHPDIPSQRVCRLLDRLFGRWTERPRWPERSQLGHLFDGKKPKEVDELRALSVAVRRGLALRETLRRAVSPEVALLAGTCEVDPDELLVGGMPPYSVGQGKELVGHLTDEEALRFALDYLDDRSAFGHIVPDYPTLLEKGVRGLIRECETASGAVSGTGDAERKRKDFYTSVVSALQGVLDFAAGFAREAERVAGSLPEEDPRRESLGAISRRLRRIPANPPTSFADALQCVLLVHCALHTAGEITPLGRLDQYLYPFYLQDVEKKRLPSDPRERQAVVQELIDCFWVKLDEHVVLDRRHAEDRFTIADGALLGAKGPSNYDQGALLNQWMQQVTIGGYRATNEVTAEDGTNELTFHCLDAARRLPLNSPTLDLRLHANVRPEHRERLFEAAARTILSGGAHPVLMNDDRIVPALYGGSGGRVELRSARNYACDGCYETLFAGETEFSFGFVPAVEILENALNRGAGISAAGPVHLRGWKRSWRTAPAEEIESFEQFMRLFDQHLLLACHRYIHGILTFYGEKEPVCPSPLLSALIANCIEKGRDLTGGGARYRLFSPLMVGISTCADSLYVIKKHVFDTRAFSLEELVTCLRRDWGKNPHAPGCSLPPGRLEQIHGLCEGGPRFGAGVSDVDALAWDVIERFGTAVTKARTDPVHEPKWRRLRETYGGDFEILFAPGVGTFEQYVFSGSFCGATPDGRYARDPIASDLSPSPLHRHRDPVASLDGKVRHRREVPLAEGLKSYASPAVSLLSDGAPGDLNLPEDFPVEELVSAIRRFAAGEAGNMMTFTVANPETFLNATQRPEDYNLLRVRMGGWTEFFITLFPDHQEQHRRRPLYVTAGAHK